MLVIITKIWQDIRDTGKNVEYKILQHKCCLRNKKRAGLVISEGNLDIICITDTWENEAFYVDTSEKYEIDGFPFYLYTSIEEGMEEVWLFMFKAIFNLC